MDAASEPAWPEDAVEVGRIVDAWGVKGWIKVQPWSSDPQALFSSRRWFLRSTIDPPGADQPASLKHDLPPLLRITHVREGDGLVYAAAQEIDDRDSALALRGMRVFISRKSFPTPDADEFYWIDLIGLAVVNREGIDLGSVAGLVETGVHSVLRVAPAADAPERLIPFVGAYVDDVDFDARVIRVDWQPDY